MITIVTPSYNQAPYLEETLLSVLRQGYPHLEYFVIDGGSSDGSVEIIRRYERQLTGWVSEKDEGQAHAINKGFQRASGEIIAWLNSDDTYQPGTLQKVEETFRQNPHIGMLYGNVLSIDEHSRPFNLQTFAPYNLPDLLSFRIISQPAVFMRREVLQQAGYLNQNYHLLLDHQLWLRVANLAPILYLPQTLASARYHSQAKNLARTADFGKEAFQIVQWLQTEPAYQPLYNHHRNKILAGAHRLNAYYLLEGSFPRQSLQAYANAFRYNPPTALKELHRILYALLLPLGVTHLRQLYNRLRAALKTRP